MAKVTMLVCDDDSITLQILGSSLALLYPDTVIHCAKDGEAGLDTFREHGADIVITDIDMPNRDGLHMIREIQSIKQDVHTIVTTAYGETSVSHSDAAAPARVDLYIRKPIDLTAVAAAIDGCIAKLSGKSR